MNPTASNKLDTLINICFSNYVLEYKGVLNDLIALPQTSLDHAAVLADMKRLQLMANLLRMIVNDSRSTILTEEKELIEQSLIRMQEDLLLQFNKTIPKITDIGSLNTSKTIENAQNLN